MTTIEYIIYTGIALTLIAGGLAEYRMWKHKREQSVHAEKHHAPV